MVTLYDQWGRPMLAGAKPDEQTLAVATIRDRWSTYPSNGLTPQRLAALLKEADAGEMHSLAELFEEMEEKDTHLFSILQTRKLAVAGLDFEITPNSEDAKDKKVAEFVSDAINGLPDFEDNLLDILDAVGKGYSGLELHWDVRPQNPKSEIRNPNFKNVVRHIEWVHPKRFTWYNTLTPRLLTEEKQCEGIELPPFKYLFHIHKMKSGHPTRQGVLRVVTWMYLFKNYSVKDWVAFAEVYGMPLRLGKYESTASKEDREALIKAIRSLGTDAAGVISKSTEIEFVEAVKNSGRDVYDLLAGFCNAEMSKAVLGQTLTTQQGDSGSYSLGQVHDKVRGDLLRADCELVAKSLRRDLIRPLVGFNFGWETLLPWFKFHYEEPEDLVSEATKVKTLTDAGVKTIPVSWVHEKFNIPVPVDGEETIGSDVSSLGGLGAKMAMKAGCGQGGLSGRGGRRCLVCKGDIVISADQRAVDTAVESLDPAGLQRQAEGVLKPILDMIESGMDYNKILESLAMAYPDMGDTALVEMLTRGIFVHETWGRLNAGG